MLAFLIFGFVAHASAQTLQAGDTIDVSVWQDSKLDRRVVIGPTGMISFPLAGHIRAGGLTPQALENVLRNRLKPNYTDRLDITVALVGSDNSEDRKPKVFITGEVLKPGSYPMTTKTSLMQAISMAGGLGPYAAKRRIQVRRKVDGVENMFVFDYVAFETGADMSGNVDVRGGDVIVVPERGLLSGLLD
ncbi:MAG: polysaccharide export protein [Bradyrhizobium sp.]|nr:polysaccharide export protein [Bradyrhizobium sp.]